jgi:tRNA threonylcarbamoyl adenosine modification protein YeaZ
MTVLGIETATHVCSAAIVRSGTVIAERSEIAPQRHAELLLPFIDAVIAEAGLGVRGLEAIAVSIGPGSFTGLRIGLSVAKGIAAGAGIPIVPVPTMDGAAFQVFQSDPDCITASVLLPARKNEYYYGRFQRTDAKPELISGIDVYTTGQLGDLLSKTGEDTIAGEGIGRFLGDMNNLYRRKETIEAKIKKSMTMKFHLSGAGVIGILSGHYEAADASSVEPLYIKEFQSGSRGHTGQTQQPE